MVLTIKTNGTRSQEINCHVTYDQMIKKGAKTQWRKDSLFNKVLGKLEIHMQKMKMDPYLTSYTNINLKLLEETEGENFVTLDLSMIS